MITLDSIDIQNMSVSNIGELLINAKKAYYTGGRPIMDDHTYDTLENILKIKAPHHRLFSKIGHPNFDTGFTKKNHIMPMGSLNKVTNFQDLTHYFELNLKRVSSNVSAPADYVVEPKCDGISVEIIYQNGQLIEAITRGDGQVGDIITQNIVSMKNIVVSLPNHFTGSIRCEIMVTKDDFKILNQTSEDLYSNPRNAASGLSQRLDGKYSQYCSLYAVDVFPSPQTETEKINILKSLGFTPVESFTCRNFEEIEKIYQNFLTRQRDRYPYEIDGLVIKINDIKLQQQLGAKNNRPKGQVAYKFPSADNQTQVKAVNWQVGPLGTITPVAEVEPIELSGAVITFASLANHHLIQKMDLNIGDIVKISRRGDVIPHIEKVITKVNTGHIDIPQYCPSCHTKLLKEDKHLRCPNSSNCPGQILGCLRLFCDRLNILGLSDKTIKKLYQANRVRLPGDFFKLKIEDISDLENMGNKSAKSIINQIQQKKILSIVEIFDASIIPNFSTQRILQLINSGFDTPDKLLNISLPKLESLPGFQSTLAKKVFDGIALRRLWIESILDNVSLNHHRSNVLTLSNMSFCITGTLSQPRKDIENLIVSHGGKILSTVTSHTNYLICNSPSNSDKYLSAQKLGIKIITEAEFSSLIK